MKAADVEKREYRFTVIIEPCEEGGYFAMCPAFPGCHVEAESYEEALNEMKAAIMHLLRTINKKVSQYLKMM